MVSAQDNKRIKADLSLPEDILRYIHALIPVQDAARAACVSHTFLQSWRSRPYLSVTFEEILGFCPYEDMTKFLAIHTFEYKRESHFIKKVDHILQNHSGIGVKTLKIDLRMCGKIDSCYIDGWLHKVFKPGIEEFTLNLSGSTKAEYNFPCSLFSNGSGNSIQCLDLTACSLRPRVGLSCLRTLTRVFLNSVRITEDELECLLSSSFALEWLGLLHCDEIIRVKVSCLSQRLSFLRVSNCKGLQAIQSDAPNLSTFCFDCALNLVHISLGDSSQVKNVEMWAHHQANNLCYAWTELLSIVPNVETLSIQSAGEMVNTPMVPGKFLHLKYVDLNIYITYFPVLYDYLSLVSFLDASPLLETFILDVAQIHTAYSSIFDNPSHLRQMSGHHHGNLKSVKITGFCSDKSMIELTCHIVENSTSLECLTLDTTNGARRCSNNCKCCPLKDKTMEAHRADLAIKTYIEVKIPSMVKFNVLEPCY